MRLPIVGAVYDRPQFGLMQAPSIVGGHRPPLQWQLQTFARFQIRHILSFNHRTALRSYTAPTVLESMQDQSQPDRTSVPADRHTPGALRHIESDGARGFLSAIRASPGSGRPDTDQFRHSD